MKIIKWLGRILLFVLIAVAIAIGYTMYMLPNVGDAPKLSIERTPERIARGDYLANSVTVCMDCHSRRDWTIFSGPIKSGTLGGGGEIFDRNLGFPGLFYSKNITPYGIGSWTDGEVFRAITTGVSKDGSALFPVMPYHYYGQMATEDIYAIIAYIRTLSPIKNEIPKREIDVPFNIILNSIPKKATPQALPKEDGLPYGAYLVNASGCIECHTPADKGQIDKKLAFSGGREFILPWGKLYTPNITPDEETGIGFWSKAKFIQTFKQYQDSAYHSSQLSGSDFNTIMPWIMYSKMTVRDLGAIYDFLRTIKPIKNNVVKFTP
jgi:mono/diheme cytochrome c family protein